MSKPKIALVIGCNYSNTSTNLKGCINDANNMRSILIDAYQYDQNNIILLTDDDTNNLPTKESILYNLNNIISESYKYSEISIYYSGHGAEPLILQDIPDPAIVPCDYIKAGCISNDTIYEIIRKTYCPIKIIMDCLQSTGLNLPYSYTPVYEKPVSGKPISNNNINFIINNGSIINQLITLFGRTDNNKITDSILSITRSNNYSLKYNDLLYNIKNIVLYSSQQLNLNGNYVKYLYYNYQMLVDTVNNFSIVVKSKK
jgi:hypothetical protein